MAMGVAEALDYLHNGCVEPVIHRDVKSSNILLSMDFEAQVLLSLYLTIFRGHYMNLSLFIFFHRAFSALRFRTC